MNWFIGFSLSLLISLSGAASAALTPRWTPPKPSQTGPIDPTQFNRDCITVKFVEGIRVRLREDKLVSLTNADLSAFRRVIANHKVKSIQRLFSAPEDRLERNRRRGQARSGKQLADLNNYYRVFLDSSQAPEPFIDSLLALPVIEDAHANPIPRPAEDIPPETPDFVERQGYLFVAPEGVNAPAAWEIEGGLGEDISIIDIEGGWNFDHEDLREEFYLVQPGEMWDEHGDAVIGIMIGQHNDYGIDGICPEAEIGGHSITDGWPNPNVANDINEVADALDEGDVFLIELHAAFNNRLSPMETWQENFDAIETAAANGIIPVEAGGNGNSNLDADMYEGRFDPDNRHSGAILVGAGAPPSGNWGPDRSRLDFSNYGQRVDLQGWGREVTTTGYGRLFFPNADRRQWYTDQFGGTSSATPIVAGSAVCIQGIYKARTDGELTLTSQEIRDILVETGTPQNEEGRQGNIGPRPNLQDAIELIPFLPATLFGTVTDAADDEPLEGIEVSLDYDLRTETDENGEWRIENAHAERLFSITFSLDGYHDSTLVDQQVGEEEELEYEVALLHSEAEFSVDEIDAVVLQEEREEIEFTLDNPGNGPLTWTGEPRLADDAGAAPWDLRRSLNIGQEVDDDRIEGVVHIDNRYYVSGSNDREPTIYVLDEDGELVDQFLQPGDDDRGMRDLAWDGELIWGTVDEQIFGFTTDGELEVEFEGPFRPITTVAYDPDREVLWCSSTTTDIIAVTLDGEIIEEWEIPRQDLRFYGLAYWQDDPDGFPLYVFHKDRDPNRQAVSRVDPENGEMEFVTFLDPPNGGNPNGAFIDHRDRGLSWVMTTIASASRNDGGDRIDEWQLAATTDWMELNPREGNLNPGERQAFEFAFDTAELMEGVYNGRLVFEHNATGGVTEIPTWLEVVVGEDVLIERDIDLQAGWSLISLNLELENDDIIDLMAPLVDEGVLDRLFDDEGRFYAPAFDFNNIPGWELTSGYAMHLSEPFHWRVEGLTVAADTPVPLTAGWNLVSYIPNRQAREIVALANIEEQIVIAKDGAGGFYLPEFDFSNMEMMQRGHGYWINVLEDVDLDYNVEIVRNQSYPARPAPSHFTNPLPASENMSVLLLFEPRVAGMEVAAASPNGVIVGTGVVDEFGRCGFPVWGGENGMKRNAPFRLQVWNERMEISGDPAVKSFQTNDEFVYRKDGLAVAEMEPQALLPENYSLSAGFPNPFNSTTRLTVSLPEEVMVDVAAVDLTGRTVTTLLKREMKPGRHGIAWQAQRVPTGVYFIRLHTPNFSAIRKVILIR